jgi:hypothetical protein
VINMAEKVLLLACVMWIPTLTAGAMPQGSSVATVPQFEISFVRGKATSGVTGSPVLKLPFQCTGDGTIFVSFVSTAPSGSGLPPPPPGVAPMLLASIPGEGAGRTFRTDQIPELYVSGERDHFAYDSGVVILVTASRENKPVKYDYAVGSYKGEATKNSAEQLVYLLMFSREGEFRYAMELSDGFDIEKIAAFPSGQLLAFGLDQKNHSPKLALLKENGTLLKFLELSVNQAPESMISGADGPRPHSVAPFDLVAVGHSIILLQNQSRYPLLEVTEGGAIRDIRPQLPEGEHIQALLPSDQDLYVIAGSEEKNEAQQFIYQISPGDGTVVRRFSLHAGRVAPDSVACVNEGKFLSIEYGVGEVIPLVGSAELASGAEKLR